MNTNFDTNFPYNMVNSSSFNSVNNNSIPCNLRDDDEPMSVIGHRGMSVFAPENTMSAFDEAVKNELDAIEFDIRWSKDDVPVLVHDYIINRTARDADGSKFILPKKVNKITYEELLKFDFGVWMGEKFANEKIPTFDDVVEFGKDNDIDFYIEIKKNSGFNEEKAKILVDKINEAGLAENVTWISYSDKYLKMINDNMPNCRLGYLSRKRMSDSDIKKLQNLKTDNNEVFLDIKSSKMNLDTAKKLKEADIDFEAWDVSSVNDAKRLYSFGCTGITTNNLKPEDISDITN